MTAGRGAPWLTASVGDDRNDVAAIQGVSPRVAAQTEPKSGAADGRGVHCQRRRQDHQQGDVHEDGGELEGHRVDCRPSPTGIAPPYRADRGTASGRTRPSETHDERVRGRRRTTEFRVSTATGTAA